MELKTNYQYTYFVHPFVIKENKYQKYMLKMLKDKNCNLKIFQKEKDVRLYRYFLPKTREFLFSSFSFSKEKMQKFEDLPLETRAAILTEYQCNIFEYHLTKDIQGKVDGDNGIFFNIQKMDVICFNTGICFLCIKTNVEEDSNFANVLNFNYKFRDINQENSNLNNYDNIRLQTDSFSDIEKFRDFIKNITGSNIEAMKLDLNTERFLTYSYACVDRVAWNNETRFSSIEYEFNKFANILPADNSRNYEESNVETFSRLKYAKIGITKLGMTLFSSSMDMNNYTILPDEYEHQYFYTYILNLYKKIYLKKLDLEIRKSNKVKESRKKFSGFTRDVWTQEITEDETGTILNHKLQDVFELDKLFGEVKSKYDVLYKEFNIERNTKLTVMIFIVLLLLLIFNVLNFLF